MHHSDRAFLALIMLIAACSSTAPPPDAAPADAGDAGEAARSRAAVRLLVVPIENRSPSRAQGPMSIGFAASLAERLERAPGVAAINGPLILTEEQVRIVSPNGTGFDPAAAGALARERGAAYVLSGEYRGQVWQTTFVIRVSTPSADGLTVVGEGFAEGDATVPVARTSGRVDRVPSAARFHELLADATDRAFSAAGIPLAPETVAALRVPPTGDAWAYLLMSRALIRHFHGEASGLDGTALGRAEHAVRVDPAFAEAQRFYAHLLVEDGRPRTARVHYEQAIARRPDDVRSLIALGRIELDARNPDIAERHFRRAIDIRPDEAPVRYWLGLALIARARPDEARAAFEEARRLGPEHLDSRRELAALYAATGRYADAAAEMAEVVARAPGSAPDRFLHAACLRAAGRSDDAISAYADAAAAFPREHRFHRFRGDLLADAGRDGESRSAYEAARRAAPRDRRVASLLNGGDGVLGGSGFRRVLADADARASLMARTRSAYQLGMNDAIADLRLNGEAACVDGAGMSAALFAVGEGRAFTALGREQREAVDDLRAAIANGESDALTPDERTTLDRVLAAMPVLERDAVEMASVHRGTLLPLARRHRCETFDGPLTPLTLDAVKERLARRTVVLPEPRHSPPSALSPDVPLGTVRGARFRIDNAAGTVDYVLSVDGAELGAVPPGGVMTFTARHGRHRLCLVPRGGACGPGAVRNVFLHDGWTLIVRPAD